MTDMVSLVDKHRNLDPEIRIHLLQIAIQGYRLQVDEVKEALRKNRIFYYNESPN